MPATLQVKLHPLVILNVSDHFTRQKCVNVKTAGSVAASQETTKVIGALMGTMDARLVTIWNSVEVPFKKDQEGVADIDYLRAKLEQYKQVFPHYELVGWYSCGQAFDQDEVLALHQAFLVLNEGALHLHLNTHLSQAKELPISVHETVKDLSSGNTHLQPIPYHIETNDAERIAVQHVAQMSTTADKNKLVSQLIVQQNAIAMLKSRVQILISYLNDVQNSVIPPDEKILRDISALLSRLPTVNSEAFDDEFNKDFEDVLLISHLSLVTKSAEALHELAEKMRFVGPRKEKGAWPRSRSMGLSTEMMMADI
ncbi:COP9 signalosome complex subunit 6 [Kappamyces sp. JEL0829]|nr:COP9 signalosome complex subunit 6 [Kappamyces sp. JEL0829]